MVTFDPCGRYPARAVEAGFCVRGFVRLVTTSWQGVSKRQRSALGSSVVDRRDSESETIGIDHAAGRDYHQDRSC